MEDNGTFFEGRDKGRKEDASEAGKLWIFHDEGFLI